MSKRHILNFNYNSNASGNWTNVSGMPSNSSSRYYNTDDVYPFAVNKNLGSAPSRPYHTFRGWSLNAGASSGYSAGSSYSYAFETPRDITATLTWYATWAHQTAYVYYDANGGSGAPSRQTHWAGYSVKLDSTIPTRSGYSFLGWSESASATSPSYSPGVSYPLYTTVTLYAVWKATITVTASNGTIGVEQILTLTKGNPNYTCTLTYSFGAVSDTIATKTPSSSVAWTPPVSLLQQIPSSVNGSCIIRCKSYDENDAEVDEQSVTIILSVASSVVPVIDSITLSEGNSDVPSKYSGILINGISMIDVAVTASGVGGSKIVSITAELNEQTLSFDFTSDTTVTADSITNLLTEIGTKTCTVTVVDTRGRSSTSSVNYTVDEYATPLLTLTSYERLASDESSVAIVCEWVIKALSNKNSKNIKIDAKLKSSSIWTEMLNQALPSYASNGTFVISNISGGSPYDLRVIITDDFGSQELLGSIPISDSWIYDYNPTTHTIAFHGEAPDDNYDHWLKKPLKFEHPIYLGNTELSESTLQTLISGEIRTVDISVSSFTQSTPPGGVYYSTVDLSAYSPRAVLAVYNRSWDEGANAVTAFTPQSTSLVVAFSTRTACTIRVVYVV